MTRRPSPYQIFDDPFIVSASIGLASSSRTRRPTPGPIASQQPLYTPRAATGAVSTPADGDADAQRRLVRLAGAAASGAERGGDAEYHGGPPAPL